jgi:zinc/manganese transport system substrate-binding protein
MKIRSLALAVTAALVLAGCAPAQPEPEPTQEPFAGITIVSSTNVWGDIAQSIGWDRVQVV